MYPVRHLSCPFRLCVNSFAQVVLRPSGVLNFCVVDEGDSVLIDEARVPLIISGKTDAPVDKFEAASKLAAVLEKGVHYDVFEKEQTVSLTDQGVRDCEKALAVSNLYEAKNPWASYVVNSIKAKELFIKDKSYLLQDGEVTHCPSCPPAHASKLSHGVGGCCLRFLPLSRGEHTATVAVPRAYGLVGTHY
eukprot:scaffold277969_cov32-Tisochrysis_lutea.AAC.3